MHEATRHTIHSFETLSVTVETVEAIQQKIIYLVGERERNGDVSGAPHQIRMHIDSQVRMLRNLLLRSQSNKERLQNEIALV